jgi:hypothetical protein
LVAVLRRVWWFGADSEVLCCFGVAMVSCDGVVMVLKVLTW